jgi:CelD/BcsL family acetyltransferase involved in cellulose biosynthesis
VDLTIGDEPYKYLFGVESTPISALYAPLTLKGKAFALLRFKGALVKRFFVGHATALKKAYSSRHAEKQKQVEQSASA